MHPTHPPDPDHAARLASRIASALEADADLLAAHWTARAHALTPGVDRAERRAERKEPPASDIVRAVIASLVEAPGWRPVVARCGWSFGVAAHHAGRSLHVALRHATLLGEVLLHAAEVKAGALAASAAGEHGSDGDGAGAGARTGIAVARRMQRAVSLLSSSAAQGFTHAHLERLQERYRSVRHDLRNPLGTIKNAVALMEDQTVPLEVRANPRYRAIITRSVGAIDGLIGERLDEASALASALDWHEVSLSAVAAAVRRELREEMVRARCEIVVDDSLPTVCTDPAVFELALASTLAALLRGASADTTIRVALDRAGELSVVVSLTVSSAQHAEQRAEQRAEQHADAILPPDALDFARSLLAKAGGRVSAGEAVCLELPVVGEGVGGRR